jgi:hypothetical protein
MVRIKNTKVYGLYESIYRSGYPLRYGEPIDMEEHYEEMYQSASDTERAIKLGNVPQGSGHDNFLKGIIVQFDLCYPQYFTPQLQRYNWMNIISSQSKMHSLTKRKNIEEFCNKYVDKEIIDIVNLYIHSYNNFEEEIKRLNELSFNIGKITDKIMIAYPDGRVESLDKYDLFMKIISNCPLGFELWMGITSNFLQLKTVYNQRRNHKLKEDWGYFCDWIETLPLFKELILKK